jgi:putative ABC transport system permease protein
VADPNADAFTQAFQSFGGGCLGSALTPGRGTASSEQRGVDVATPGTDIRSGQFTLAGIEPGAAIGVVSPDEVTSGRFPARSGEAMVSEGYAAGKQLKVGSTLELKGRSFKVVGVTTSPLVGEPNDIYLSLADLQAVSGHKGETSTILVRAASASKVDDVSAAIQREVEGASVSNASALAERVEGSLVDSQSLIRGLALVLGIIGMIAAVLIAALLTLSSVAKRAREVGTLKAIGWGPRLIVRQIVAESAAQGVLGGLLGVALGFGGAALLSVFGPTLAARAVARSGFGSGGFFGLGNLGEQASEAVRLTAPIRPSMVALAVILALSGGLVAGAVGATRAARLGPADAMRGVS